MDNGDNENNTIFEKEREIDLRELNNSTNMLINYNKRKFIVIMGVFLIIVILRVILGPLNIPNIFGYPSSSARYYKVLVNDEHIPVNYNLKHSIPIIPFIVNINSVYLGNNYVAGGNNDSLYVDYKDVMNLNINSYSCFSEKMNTQIECKYDNQITKENSDEKYTKLVMTKIGKEYGSAYNGEFIVDIAPYIKEKGRYHVEITAKHGLVETKIYFYVNKKTDIRNL